MFEAEMRRRLWHYCIILDIRASEDRGSDSLIQTNSYNTLSPTSIDDDAFGPGSTEPLVPKLGPAENVITLTQAMACAIFEHLGNPETYNPQIGQASLYTEQGVLAAVKRMENAFIRTVDPTHKASLYAADVARICILRLWLAIQYPLSSQAVPTRPRVNAQTLLETAVSALELSDKLLKPPYEEHWRWLAETFVQWHPLAVTLSILCTQTTGPEVEHAWKVVELTFATQKEKIADSAKGALWKPIRKMAKRARAARAAALMHNMTLDEQHRQQQQQAMPPPMQHQHQHWQQPPLPGMMQPHPHYSYQGMPQPIPQQMMTPISATPGSMISTPYDPMHMDPSYLFEYPPDIRNVEFEAQFQNIEGMPINPWNDFLHDTMAEEAGMDSGGDSV